VIYVVQRLEWRAVSEGLLRLPGRTRLVSFAEHDQAEAECRKREDEARAGINPFTCDGPALITKTSLDEGRLHDWILDLDLTPPRNSKTDRDWVGWWKKTAPRMTDLQRARMWEAFDRLRFFEVVERPQRRLGYALVRINWEYSDEYYYAEPEGGTVFTIYLDRTKALSELEDYNDVGQDVWSDCDDEGFEDDKRLQMDGDPLRPAQRLRARSRKTARQVKFWEVIEVELEL
jgi:hypothetical protein